MRIDSVSSQKSRLEKGWGRLKKNAVDSKFQASLKESGQLWMGRRKSEKDRKKKKISISRMSQGSNKRVYEFKVPPQIFL